MILFHLGVVPHYYNRLLSFLPEMDASVTVVLKFGIFPSLYKFQMFCLVASLVLEISARALEF